MFDRENSHSHSHSQLLLSLSVESGNFLEDKDIHRTVRAFGPVYIAL